MTCEHRRKGSLGSELGDTRTELTITIVVLCFFHGYVWQMMEWESSSQHVRGAELLLYTSGPPVKCTLDEKFPETVREGIEKGSHKYYQMLENIGYIGGHPLTW